MSLVKYSVKIVDENTTADSSATHYVNRRRISVRLKRPNPLFEMWLEEMIAKAEEKNTMSRIALQKALTSLRRYPLPLASGRDCIMLMDFGKTICENLDRRLKAYLASGGRVITDHNPAIEAILNNEHAEHYRELTKPFRAQYENEPGVERAVLVSMEETMQNDSIFDHLPDTLAEHHFVRISHPKAVLLVDTGETIGKTKISLDRTLQELAQHSIEYVVRRLSVGDFVWMVRDDSGREFLLPYIVERKRIDDLANSIKDGRFHEQKFRLKQCGLPNVIYLIEHLGMNRQVGIPEATLAQAALNTYVQGFTVKHTENHHHTVLYLSVMTNFLNNLLKNKPTYIDITRRPFSDDISVFGICNQTIPLLLFDYFYKQSSKTRDYTVRDVFMKQLLQIKLLTIEKVNTIVEKYPTPQCLHRAYECCTSETERQRMLNLPYGSMKRMIGEKLSKIVYHLMTNQRYTS